MRRTSNNLALVILSLVLLAPASASAQWIDSWGTSWNNPISQSLGNMLFQNVFYGTPLPISGDSAKRRDYDEGRISFRRVRSGKVASDVASEFASGDDKADKEKLLQVLRILEDEYGKYADQMDGRDNLAFVTASFTLTLLTIYKGEGPDYAGDLAQRNLFDTMTEKLAVMPALSKLSSMQKQEMHDRLVYVMGLIGLGYASALEAKDAPRLRLFRSLAGSALKSAFKIDPGKLSVEDDRLVVR